MVLFKRFLNFLLSTLCLVLEWAAFGVLQRLPPSKIFQLKAVDLQVVSSNLRDMRWVILLQPSSFFYWFRKYWLGKERCSRLGLAFGSGNPDNYSQEWVLPGRKSSWESTQKEWISENPRLHPGDQGYVEKTLATFHLCCTAYDNTTFIHIFC